MRTMPLRARKKGAMVLPSASVRIWMDVLSRRPVQGEEQQRGGVREGGGHDGCVSVNLRNPSFRSDLPPVLPAWLKIPFALPTMHVTLQGWPSSSTSWVSLPSEDRTERASRRTSVRLWKSGPTWRASFLALSPEMGSGC